MKLAHKKPCSECPWRREAPAGWLGGYPAEDFVNQVHHDGPPLPCHKTISMNETADHEELPDTVNMCAGALIHMKNSCKSAQHPGYGNARDQVERDVENVFMMPSEFLAHHADTEGWAKRAMEKITQDRAVNCTGTGE